MFSTEKFFYCCGVVQVYMYGSIHRYQRDGIFNKKMFLQICTETALEQMKTRSVMLAVLTESQKKLLHEAMLEFGWKEIWGPVNNINSKTNLYGYFFDLNLFREANTNKSVSLLKK